MGEATKTNGLAHHTFSPWRVEGDRRIVAGEQEWDAVKLWESFPSDELQYRPRVLVGVDVFEGWKGRIRSESGLPLEKSIIPGNKWFENTETYGPKDGAGLTMQDVRDRLFYLIDVTPNLDWLVFTRTPENIKQMTPLIGRDVIPDDECGIPVKCPWDRPNLWIGTDIDDQATADERIPHLLRVPAAVRMVRYSGVGRVNLSKCFGDKWVCPECGDDDENGKYLAGPHHRYCYNCAADCGKDVTFRRNGKALNLLIISGEVGPGARPCNLEHVRDAIQQAQAAGVKVWVERLGSRPVAYQARGGWPPKINKPMIAYSGGDGICIYKLRNPRGADPAEWPEDLRVREVPT